VPVTVTVLALVAVTVKVDESPGAIEVGAATMFTVGFPGAATVTVTVAEALPLVPVALAV
jgi:hypothetical protein